MFKKGKEKVRKKKNSNNSHNRNATNSYANIGTSLASHQQALQVNEILDAIEINPNLPKYSDSWLLLTDIKHIYDLINAESSYFAKRTFQDVFAKKYWVESTEKIRKLLDKLNKILTSDESSSSEDSDVEDDIEYDIDINVKVSANKDMHKLIKIIHSLGSYELPVIIKEAIKFYEKKKQKILNVLLLELRDFRKDNERLNLEVQQLKSSYEEMLKFQGSKETLDATVLSMLKSFQIHARSTVYLGMIIRHVEDSKSSSQDNVKFIKSLLSNYSKDQEANPNLIADSTADEKRTPSLLESRYPEFNGSHSDNRLPSEKRSSAFLDINPAQKAGGIKFKR